MALSGKLLEVLGTRPRNCPVERGERPEKKPGHFRKSWPLIVPSQGPSLSPPMYSSGQGWVMTTCRGLRLDAVLGPPQWIKIRRSSPNDRRCNPLPGITMSWWNQSGSVHIKLKHLLWNFNHKSKWRITVKTKCQQKEESVDLAIFLMRNQMLIDPA